MVTLMLLINFLQKMRLVLCRLLLQLNKLTNFKNFKKLFKKGITPLLCALTIFNLCGIYVNAAPVDSPDYIYEVHTNEPFVSDTCGYFMATRYVSTFTDYVYIWQLVYSVEVGSDGGIQPFAVSLTYSDSGILFEVQSDIPCIIHLYEIPNWGGNTGIVSVDTLIVDGSTQYASKNLNWGYSNATTPYGFAYGKYYSINKGNTNFNTAVSFFDDYDINVYLNTINSNVSSLINNSNAIMNSTSSINTYVSGIPGRLDTINSGVNNIRTLVNDIKNLLNSGNSNSAPEDVSSSGVINVTNKEQELLNKNDSVSSDINSLQVDINPNASAVTWNLLNTAVMSNSKVFTMFLSILTIGIIGLILNR